MYPQALNTRWIDCSKTSYMLYLETSTFKKFTCLPRLGKMRKQVQLSTQSSSSLPDSPHGCWERLACQVTHAEQEPKSFSLLVKMKQAPYWKTALFRGITAVDDAIAILLSHQAECLPGTSFQQCQPVRCIMGTGPVVLCQSILPFFIPSLHKQHTLTANIYMKQAMIKYTYLIAPSPLSRESPWVTLHCFDLQFSPDSSAALLFHVGRSFSFGFALPVASASSCSLLVWLQLASNSWGKKTIFWGCGDLVWQVLCSLR